MTTKYQHGTIEKHKRGTDKPQSQNVGEDILEWSDNDYKYQHGKIEKHKRGNNKPKRNKVG